MMTGFFTAEGEPTLSVHLAGPAGNLDVDAVIDPGFNGEFTFRAGRERPGECPENK